MNENRNPRSLGWICRSHREGETACLILAHRGVLVEEYVKSSSVLSQ